MDSFATLLDQLYFTNSTNTKSLLIQDYLRTAPAPDRGWAIAALAGTLSFDFFKRNTVKQLMLAHTDETLFLQSYDYVGELSETVAHLWPYYEPSCAPLPGLGDIIELFQQSSKDAVPEILADLLTRMSPSQRWALLKLGTRGLRVGVSARALKHALAEFGQVDVSEVERVWHGLSPPYLSLLAWLEGRMDVPDVSDALTFQPVMLSHPVDETELDTLLPTQWQTEWKYDGIRVQLISNEKGVALFSRTGDDISHSFADLLDTIDMHGRLDGELLVMQEQEIDSFNALQQRLNKKKPSKKLQQQYPAHLMIYDALELQGESLIEHPLRIRRENLEAWFSDQQHPRLHLSPVLNADSQQRWLELREQARIDNTLEGLMIKRLESVYVAGRPKGQWYKWKRDPLLVDAVMMYAQRGHGKRSSYYSDYTFGCWQDDTLLPIGKAYSGFTDEELKRLDRWVRANTIGRFGPVKEVEKALVLEVAFDAVHPSKRHKSGVALRFPRIHRIRWDKPASEADTLSNLVAMIKT